MGNGSLPKSRYDFAIYDPDGRLSLVLEAKKRLSTSSSWARAWHETIVENEDQPSGASVAVITPERIYAWHPGAGAAAEPDWVVDATPWLAPYFARLRIAVTDVHPHVFEQIVGMWLHDVAESKTLEGGDEAGRKLLDMLRGGQIVEQAAA